MKLSQNLSLKHGECSVILQDIRLVRDRKERRARIEGEREGGGRSERGERERERERERDAAVMSRNSLSQWYVHGVTSRMTTSGGYV